MPVASISTRASGTNLYVILKQLLLDHSICRSARGLEVKLSAPFPGIDSHVTIAENPTDNQALKYAGILSRQGFHQSHRAFHAILRRSGLQQAIIDEWSRRADQGQKLTLPCTVLFMI